MLTDLEKQLRRAIRLIETFDRDANNPELEKWENFNAAINREVERGELSEILKEYCSCHATNIAAK
jgi:hypothetical protein